jgi:hypothetical protein
MLPEGTFVGDYYLAVFPSRCLVWKSDKEIKKTKECAIRAQEKVLVYMAVAALEKVGIMEVPFHYPQSQMTKCQTMGCESTSSCADKEELEKLQ